MCRRHPIRARTQPADFVGSALGQSEERTKAILDGAKGSVLVIDEAYGLHVKEGSTDPYKTAVIDTIVAEVQCVAGDDRCVLLLGYPDQMRTMMREANPGLGEVLIPLRLDMSPDTRFQAGLIGGSGSPCPGLIPMCTLSEYTWILAAGIIDRRDEVSAISKKDASGHLISNSFYRCLSFLN